VRILQDQPCHEYIFAADRKPVKKFKIFSEYKKSRNKIAFDPKPVIMDALVTWGAKILYSEDNEADDAIASYVGEHLDMAITVASTDKDLWQLCELPHIKVYNFHAGKFISVNELKEAYELDNFAHIKLHKSLWGDSSDNVPNLAPRLQKQLLPLIKKTDGSLREFWRVVDENSSTLSDKCLEILRINKSKIKINYELVRLNFDCKVVVEKAVKEKKPLELSGDLSELIEEIPF
jgi:5'-3' exonuclease